MDSIFRNTAGNATNRRLSPPVGATSATQIGTIPPTRDRPDQIVVNAR